MDIALVLDSIRPGAAWRRSDSYANLVATWEDKQKTCPTQAELDAGWAAVLAAQTDSLASSNLEQLWQAAHDYEYNQISGSAVGLLALSVAANRAKAIAVMGWIHGIWVLYYTRKATVTGDTPISPTSLDFTSCGAIPHTVPELMAEAGM